jgi:hypothetical protein
MFSGDRSEIYAMFQIYQKVCAGMFGKFKRNLGANCVLHTELGMYDKIDVVRHIYQHIKQNGYKGKPVHDVYVDEVQDLTQAELKLFFLICKINGGFFFAGDTAQTIERGKIAPSAHF